MDKCSPDSWVSADLVHTTAFLDLNKMLPVIWQTSRNSEAKSRSPNVIPSRILLLVAHVWARNCRADQQEIRHHPSSDHRGPNSGEGEGYPCYHRNFQGMSSAMSPLWSRARIHRMYSNYCLFRTWLRRPRHRICHPCSLPNSCLS